MNNTIRLDLFFLAHYHKNMKFNFFKKSEAIQKKLVKDRNKESVLLVKEEFSKLTKHNLALPISLYQL